MKLAQRQFLIALLALLCGGAAVAADAPPADDKKKDEKAAEKPAEPELPSKPYPKNATPKAFAPRGELKKPEELGSKPADKPSEKLAEKGAEKAEKGADKPADKGAEKPAEKSAEKSADKRADKPAEPAVAKHEPAHDKPATSRRRQAAAPKAARDPALSAVAADVLEQGKASGSYQLKAAESLDSVIRKTMPDSPFSMEVMRAAFLRANPQLLAGVKSVPLKSGTMLRLPGADDLRQVVLGDAPQKKAVDLHTAAPVVAPTMSAGTTELNLPLALPRQPVDMPVPAVEAAADDKRRWVRYP